MIKSATMHLTLPYCEYCDLQGRLTIAHFNASLRENQNQHHRLLCRLCWFVQTVFCEKNALKKFWHYSSFGMIQSILKKRGAFDV